MIVIKKIHLIEVISFKKLYELKKNLILQYIFFNEIQGGEPRLELSVHRLWNYFAIH